MKKIIEHIEGDKTIWAIAAILAIFSFLPVYSASSNLANLYGSGNTLGYVFKHLIHLFLGFTIMYAAHKIPYNYYKGISLLMIPVIIVLLAYTIFQPSLSDTMTNTNRWIKIPVLGFTFQPSTLASTILLIYIVRYFAKIKDEIISFSKTILPLWLPVFTVVVLILPANFSTAAILFTLVLIISFLGGYPKRYLILIVSTGLFVLTLFVLTIKAYPELMPNRIDTWSNRIENFIDSENTESNYQIEKAKIAIATGGIKGLGPGKSVQKNFLPQSSSDFIYAIIIEEFGLIGGFFLVILYVWLLFRVVIVSVKSETVFGSLLAISMGLPIIFQAFINMSVAVELMPITGQTLPLISSGGTSIWMTCLSIGIILSVSRRYKDQNEVVDHNNPLEILKETI